jgi:hypothetical protein
MEALLQALEIIFEVQAKRSNEKIARRKITFSTHKMCFFPSSLFFFWLFLSSSIAPHTQRQNKKGKKKTKRKIKRPQKLQMKTQD